MGNNNSTPKEEDSYLLADRITDLCNNEDINELSKLMKDSRGKQIHWRKGMTPLHTTTDNLNMLYYLLCSNFFSKYINSQEEDDGLTPIQCFILTRNLGGLMALRFFGADIRLMNNEGQDSNEMAKMYEFSEVFGKNITEFLETPISARCALAYQLNAYMSVIVCLNSCGDEGIHMVLILFVIEKFLSNDPNIPIEKLNFSVLPEFTALCMIVVAIEEDKNMAITPLIKRFPEEELFNKLAFGPLKSDKALEMMLMVALNPPATFERNQDNESILSIANDSAVLRVLSLLFHKFIYLDFKVVLELLETLLLEGLFLIVYEE